MPSIAGSIPSPKRTSTGGCSWGSWVTVTPRRYRPGSPTNSAVVEEAGPHLRTRPAPGEWSVLEVLGHILDAEIALAGRYRWILAQDEPILIGYDQDRWVERLHSQDDDPEEMLALFRALRSSHLRLWAGASESDRARLSIHSERGPESFDLSFRLMAGHGLYHLGQMRRTLAQVAAS